jgi:hypothetical protein
MRLMTLAMICFVGLLSESAATVYAGCGSAYIPTVNCPSDWETYVTITNISSNDVAVNLKIYKDTGDLLQDPSTSATSGYLKIKGSYIASTYSEGNLSDSSATFSLEPNKSVLVYVLGGWGFGHGIIAWDGAGYGNNLIANAYTVDPPSGPSTVRNIPINGGSPF